MLAIDPRGRTVVLADDNGVEARILGPEPAAATFWMELPVLKDGESLTLAVGRRAYRLIGRPGRRLALDIPRSCEVDRSDQRKGGAA